MDIGIILISHGDFAKAALKSACMITGEQQQIQALSLYEDSTVEELEQEVEKAYHTLRKHNQHILALCDIYGGSPCNAIMKAMLKGKAMIAYTGLSLPLLIDILCSKEQIQSIDELKAHIHEVQKMIVQEVILPSFIEADDEM